MKNRAVIEEQSLLHDSFYLYDENQILESVNVLKSRFPQIHFLYSVKCNPNPHVLHSVFNAGLGADAASLGEVLLAQRAGLPQGEIYYSAPGKTVTDLECAIDKSVIIADSLGEVERIGAIGARLGRKIDIGLRINPDFTFEGETGLPSKFGVDEDEALAFLERGGCGNVRITGIHLHIKSQELNPEALAAYYGRTLRLAESFCRLCGGLDYVNMGSGMGIQYSAQERPLDMELLAASVGGKLDEFRAAHPKTRLIIEVGRYAVGKSGVYVTKVLDRKLSHGKTFIILKNTLNGFMRPSLAVLLMRSGAPAAAEPLFTGGDAFQFLALKSGGQEERVTLVGNLCTSTDVIAEDISLPRLDCGDCLVITNAGSYAAALSPMQFSTQERPAELFLTSGGEIKSS